MTTHAGAPLPERMERRLVAQNFDTQRVAAAGRKSPFSGLFRNPCHWMPFPERRRRGAKHIPDGVTNMPGNKECLVQWLRGRETQAESMLQAQASRLESYPELRGRIERHIETTRRQTERLEGGLDRRELANAPAQR